MRPYVSKPLHAAAIAGLLALAAAVAGCASGGSAAVQRPSTAAAGAAAEAPRWAVVIDAGSSGSRLHLYRWWVPEEGGVPRVVPAPEPRRPGEEPWKMKVEPGISSFANRPQEVGPYLQPLLDFAREKIGGAEAAARTPLYLMATAGMRLLDAPDQQRILAAVHRSLAASPFDVREVAVISGAQEGLFGWISVNYLLGYLDHGGPFPSVGALDLGGASTQITFVPLDLPRDHGTTLELGGGRWPVYSYSYLGLGQDQARRAVASPACFPRGYPLPEGGEGSGDFPLCRKAIAAWLEGPCAEGPCSRMGVYQPPVYGDFLAFSGYYYTAGFFQLGADLSPRELDAAGRDYCGTAWTDILAAHPGGEGDPYLPNYCFNAAYISTLLTEGFGFSPDARRIVAPDRIQGQDVGWPLGALVWELAGGSAD